MKIEEAIKPEDFDFIKYTLIAILKAKGLDVEGLHFTIVINGPDELAYFTDDKPFAKVMGEVSIAYNQHGDRINPHIILQEPQDN